MQIKFEGLEELIREFENVANEDNVDKVNINIIKECAKVVEKNLKPRVHRSKEVKYSGITGMRTGQHAADNIEVTKVKGKRGIRFAYVGWDQSKSEPYNYMQWEEWGNTTRAPHAILYPTIEASQGEMSKVAEAEYSKMLNKLR